MKNEIGKILKGKTLIFIALLLTVGVSFAAKEVSTEDSLVIEEELNSCECWYGDRLVPGEFLYVAHDGGPYNDTVVFSVRKVGWDETKEVNHLAYTFYVIADPHIGDVMCCDDYNCDGSTAPLDFSCENMGDDDGSYPGKHLNAAIDLLNSYHKIYVGDGVESGEGFFCIVVGDLANTAERAEHEHAEIKLDSLMMPWLPIIGNHDTWPRASGKTHRADDYFQLVFLDKWQLAERIFPNWEKQPYQQFDYDNGKIGFQNWAFDFGPNQHFGLDVTKRSSGGVFEWCADIHDSYSDGTWNWLVPRIENSGDHHERLIIAAHHPLDFGGLCGSKKQFRCDDADSLINLIDNNESEIACWFAGHEKDGINKYWAVGPDKDNPNDTTIVVHFNIGTDVGYPIYPMLVRVYSDFVCDYTVSDNEIKAGESVTFTSASEDYTQLGYITERYWDFRNGHTDAGGQVSYAFTSPGEYWVVHRVKNNYDKYAYMVRRILVNVQPLWLDVEWVLYGTGTPGGPVETEDCKQWASLKWSENYYPGWIIDHYTAHRYGPYKKLVWVSNPPGGYWMWVSHGPELYPFKTLPWTKPHCIDNHFTTDNGLLALTPPYYLPGDFGQWRVDVTYSGRGTYQSNIVEKIAPECPPPGGCPEVYTYYSSYYDSTTQETAHMHIANNTILPHSEIVQYAGQVRTDLLKLEGFNPESEHYYLNISENDNEISYIDEAKLWVVDHPEGTEVATSSDGSIYVYSDVGKPLSCQDQGGVDRYDEVEYQDDQAFLGDSSSYLTVSFPNNGWANQGLLLGTGIPSGGSEAAPMPKDYLGIPKKPDGGGGWIPMGEAFARKEPSLWMFDVSDVQDNTFRIDCSGDLCYINYVGLVRLEESDWTKTAMLLDSAVHWYPYGAGMEGSNVSTQVCLIDSVYVILYPDNQLALRFDTLQSSSLVRDFVLQTSGFYIPGEVQGGGQSTGPSDLAFSLTIPQTITFTKTVSICYTLPYSTSVKIAVYDVQGRLVNKLVDGEASQGVHELMWNGKDGQNRSVSAGVYFIRMNADDFEQNRKIVLLK